MGWPVVTVASGGIPVTTSTNGLGVPLTEAANKLGTAITFVAKGGIPVLGGAGNTSPALNYSPVYWATGDSQSIAQLSASDQTAAAAGYVVTPKVKVLNSAGAFVTYTPGTITGMDTAVNTGNCGSELGYIAAFRAAYPNDTLYIVKDGASGSYQTRGPSTGTATISSTGNNQITVTGTVNSNELLTGAGIETGVYFPFSGFISSVGLANGRVGPAIASTTATRYNGTRSWSSTEGLIYNGNSGAITNGARARMVAAMALLTNPRIDIHDHILGTNDIGLASLTTYGTDLDAMYARFLADIPGYSTYTKMVTPRASTGGTSSTAVRAAQLAKRDQVKIFLLDTDSYTKWDGTHWNLAAHQDMGAKNFGIRQGTFSGI